jgi:hypothetical protein
MKALAPVSPDSRQGFLYFNSPLDFSPAWQTHRTAQFTFRQFSLRVDTTPFESDGFQAKMPAWICGL